MKTKNHLAPGDMIQFNCACVVDIFADEYALSNHRNSPTSIAKEGECWLIIDRKLRDDGWIVEVFRPNNDKSAGCWIAEGIITNWLASPDNQSNPVCNIVKKSND